MNLAFVRWLFWTAGGFLLGSVMFSSILPKQLAHVDVTAQSPDRNPGATNVFALCGIPLGMLCLLLDLGKGFLPVLLAGRALDVRRLSFAAVMAAPVLGHAVAPLNRFHGGKCIATSFGVMLAILPFSRIGLALAGLYIFFTLIRLRPTRVRSIVVYVLFGLYAVPRLILTGRPSFALGCGATALIAALRHTRLFAAVPEAQKRPERANAQSNIK